MKFVTFLIKQEKCERASKSILKTYLQNRKKHNFAPTSFDSRAFLVRLSLVRNTKLNVRLSISKILCHIECPTEFTGFQARKMDVDFQFGLPRGKV